MQQYAGIYLLQNYSTCFGCPSHPWSGVHKTVNCSLWYKSYHVSEQQPSSNVVQVISRTWTTVFLQRGL